MKSDRQAERTALSCFGLGFFCATAGRCAAAGAAAVTGRGDAMGGAVMDGAVTGGADGSAVAAAAGVAAGTARTTFWHPGESSAALARKHSRRSGLPGAIHEQCAMKSWIVQVR